MAKKILKQSKAKKRWFIILSPKTMGEKPIGESHLYDSESAMNRTVKVNLMHLTGDVKNQNSEVKFEINEIKENKLNTRIISYNFSPASIKRYVRRRMTRVDDSLVIKTKDNIKVRVKPFILTRNKVSKSVEFTLRAMMKDELIKYVRETDYETLFNQVIKYQIQKDLREKLGKIYPIKSLEIRVLKLEKLESVKESAGPVKIKTKKKDEEPKKSKKTKEKSEEDILIEEAQKDMAE